LVAPHRAYLDAVGSLRLAQRHGSVVPCRQQHPRTGGQGPIRGMADGGGGDPGV